MSRDQGPCFLEEGQREWGSELLERLLSRVRGQVPPEGTGLGLGSSWGRGQLMKDNSHNCQPRWLEGAPRHLCERHPSSSGVSPAG